MDKRALLDFAVSSGEILMESGCETHRIENEIKKILSARDFKKIEIFVTTSGIVATIDSDETGIITIVKHVQKRSMNSGKITLVENIVDQFLEGQLSSSEALECLGQVPEASPYSFIVTAGAFGGTGLFRALLFGGSIFDGIAAFFAALGIGVTVYIMNKKHSPSFLVNLTAAFVTGVIASVIIKSGIGSSLDKAILGALMPIAPGVPFAHAVHDVLQGEYISGTFRTIESIFTAVALGAGVYCSMIFMSPLLGGLKL